MRPSQDTHLSLSNDTFDQTEIPADARFYIFKGNGGTYYLREQVLRHPALGVTNALDVEVVNDSANLLELVVRKTDLARGDVLLGPVRVRLQRFLPVSDEKELQSRE